MNNGVGAEVHCVRRCNMYVYVLLDVSMHRGLSRLVEGNTRSKLEGLLDTYTGLGAQGPVACSPSTSSTLVPVVVWGTRPHGVACSLPLDRNLVCSAMFVAELHGLLL